MASDFKSLNRQPQNGEQTRELPTWMAKLALPCASMWSLGRNLDKMPDRGNWNWLGREFFNVLNRLKGWKLSGWDLLYISVHWCNLSENFIVAEHFCSALGWLVRLRNGEAKGVAWNVEWTEWTSMDISICRVLKSSKQSHSNSSASLSRRDCFCRNTSGSSWPASWKRAGLAEAGISGVWRRHKTGWWKTHLLQSATFDLLWICILQLEQAKWHVDRNERACWCTWQETWWEKATLGSAWAVLEDFLEVSRHHWRQQLPYWFWILEKSWFLT